MLNAHTIIIGGSSGIGLATARRLLAAGATVTIAGRDADRLATARAELEGKATTAVADAADPERMRQVFATQGRFDHLVLALGSRRGVGPFADIAIDEVRKGFEEKVFTQFQCAQLALPHLAPGGSITFVSALSAHAAGSGTAGIGAQNAAVSALVPILANELKPVRVNGVAPGVIDTPWWDFLPAEHKQAAFADFAGRIPLARVGTADDVADVIAFLVGNTYVTGQVVLCDGGLALNG